MVKLRNPGAGGAEPVSPPFPAHPPPAFLLCAGQNVAPTPGVPLSCFCSFKKKLYILIYFWLCWVFLAAKAFSSFEWALLFIAVRGLLIAVTSLFAVPGL